MIYIIPFQELVQNAEDAGASEMKILYDGRRLNTDIAKKVPYRKFFKVRNFTSNFISN